MTRREKEGARVVGRGGKPSACVCTYLEMSRCDRARERARGWGDWGPSVDGGGTAQTDELPGKSCDAPARISHPLRRRGVHVPGQQQADETQGLEQQGGLHGYARCGERGRAIAKVTMARARGLLALLIVLAMAPGARGDVATYAGAFSPFSPHERNETSRGASPAAPTRAPRLDVPFPTLRRRPRSTHYCLLRPNPRHPRSTAPARAPAPARRRRHVASRSRAPGRHLIPLPLSPLHSSPLRS